MTTAEGTTTTSQKMDTGWRTATIVGGLKKAMEVSLENIKSSLKVTTEVKSR